jgi:thymidylate synthase ThyX
MAERNIKLIDELVLDVAKENNVDLHKGENLGEVNGMVVARLSQSAKPFKDIIKEIVTNNGFDKDKVKDFHERITLGWGHHSIEQHANVSVAFENVSIIGTNKYYENKRLAAYLERSTRYQDFSTPNYYTPKEFNEEQKKEYENVMQTLFDAYAKILPMIIEEVGKNWKERGKDNSATTIKKKAFDCARYILPSSTNTNFGMTTNSQIFRSLIHDLKSSENLELIESADELQKELTKVYPALVSAKVSVADKKRSEHRNKDKKIEPIETETTKKIKIENYEFPNIQNTVKLLQGTENSVALVCYNYLVQEGFNASKVGDKIFLDGSEINYEEILQKVFTYNFVEKKAHRAAELANYYFDTIIDFGGGRDIHRNRMLTWIDSLVSPEYGFAIPYYLTAEAEEIYLGALKTAFSFWIKLVGEGISKEIAQYVLPLATNYRVLYTVNARELQHVAKTRTTAHAHFSYREYVHKLVEEVKKKDPLIGNRINDFFASEL